MNADALVEQWLGETRQNVAADEPLPDEIASVVVERLKAEADRHWWINANHSLEIADLIFSIGAGRGDICQQALGLMARGDALKLLGRTEEAWDALGEAGTLYRDAGDEVGWARTRIGRLLICLDLNRVPEALTDAQLARTIFARCNEQEKLLRLDFNTAYVYMLRGEHQRALTLYQRAIEVAQTLADGQVYLATLYTNLGFCYELLGQFREARHHHIQAREIAEARNDTRLAAVAQTNIAIIAMRQGHYRDALDLLHRVHALYIAERSPRDAADVGRVIVECYLALNRYDEARLLAHQVTEQFHSFGAAYEEAITLLHLATAAAHLGDLASAQQALDEAERHFTALDADAWLARTRLRRGRIALLQGDLDAARLEALAAAYGFERSGQQVEYAGAALLRGQIDFDAGNTTQAAKAASLALRIAQHANVPPLRYATHLLLGRIAETTGDHKRAERRYRAAGTTVERVQRGLTITLRPGFLEDKGEALRRLISLHLRHGHARQALETLERAKSQVLLSYLENREQLRWNSNDPHCRMLVEELDRLRDEHQWFYRLTQAQPSVEAGQQSSISPQQAHIEVERRERRMRAITEQLYLNNVHSHSFERMAALSAGNLQEALAEDSLLVEYYNDGTNMWAFTIARDTIEAHPLPLTVDSLDTLVAQLQANIAAALATGSGGAQTRGLTALGVRLLQRLYQALIAPIASHMQGIQRLVLVPYGALHYLPFHLLHNGSSYLIESTEVVVLPAAGLLTRRPSQRPAGALVVAHSSDGRLPQTMAEATIVRELFGGDMYVEREARRGVLQGEPRQILHIAAHGAYRLDRPDLSFIELADGQLYTDDLLQEDLRYELVTLSACETGRANVAAGDELIGLGRGFLYAGATSLITSLWRVADDTAVLLMEALYQALQDGASKAAALRGAQQIVRRAHPGLHPAFWGPFQLIGDAGPLLNTAVVPKGA